MSLPDEDKVGKALQYLAETDGEYGQLVGAVTAHEHFVKVAKANAFLRADGSAAQREQEALASEEYRQAVEDLTNVTADRETIRAKRKRAELVVAVWQTCSANRRQGP